MYPLSQKPIRDRLHRQACERAGVAQDANLSRLPVTLRMYEEAVQDMAVARIAQLENAIEQIIFDCAEALEPGNDREGLSDALKQILRRAHAVKAGNTTTRQPDDG